MITQTILNWFSNMLYLLVSALPALPDGVRNAFVALPANVQTVSNSIATLGPIVPFAHISAGLVTIGLCWVAAMGIHLVLKVVSFATLGGGAT